MIILRIYENVKVGKILIIKGGVQMKKKKILIWMSALLLTAPASSLIMLSEPVTVKADEMQELSGTLRNDGSELNYKYDTFSHTLSLSGKIIGGQATNQFNWNIPIEKSEINHVAMNDLKFYGNMKNLFDGFNN